MDKIKFPSWQELSNPVLYRLALLVSLLITLACLVGSFSRVLSLFQTNTWGPLGAFFALTLALVVLVMVNFAGGMGGYLTGWVGEIIRIAKLRAMVLSQASSILLLQAGGPTWLEKSQVTQGPQQQGKAQLGMRRALLLDGRPISRRQAEVDHEIMVRNF